jgi:hypothetical protein
MSQSVFVLDEVGDQFAEPGSRSWAVYFVNRAKIVRDQVHNDVSSLKSIVERLEKHEAWKHFGLPSFSMLCATKLKLASEELDAIMKAKRGQTVGEVLALKPHGTNRFAEDRGNKNENITSIEQRGTASTYRIAKLKRDSPEIAERLASGEFPNVREAERAAGMPVPNKLTSLEKIQRAFTRLDAGDQARFVYWLANRS